MSGVGIRIYLYIITLILVAFSLSTFILLIYSLLKENKLGNASVRRGVRSKKGKLRKRQFPTILCAFFEFCSCCVFIGVVHSLDPHSNKNFETNTNFLISIIFCALFIFSSKLSLYAQFLVRLFNTFKGSALRMNKSTMIASTVLFIISIILLLWWIILVIVKNNAATIKTDSYYSQIIVILILLIVTNGALAHMIVILFSRKLFRFLLFKDRSMFLKQAEHKLGVNQLSDAQKLVADDSDEENNHANIGGANRSKNLNLPKLHNMRKTYSFVLDIVGAGIDDKDMKTLDLITKQFLLSGLSNIIITIVYLTLIFVVVFHNELEEHYIWIYWLFGGLYYPLHVITNCIVLYFNYKFAAKYYDCCCKICHKKCKDCAIKHAAKEIYKQHYHDLTLKNNS